MRLIRRALAMAVASLLPRLAQAAPFEPAFAAPATVAANRQEALTSLRLPVGPFADGGMQTRLVEGALDQTAWRIAAPGATTLQLLAPLRARLAAAGWRTLYECETQACGGFDFRYGMDVMPEPDMHVDLGDFRYLAAEQGEGPAAQVVALLVSRTAVSGFVQVTQVGPALPPAPLPAAPTAVDPAAPDPAGPAAASAADAADPASAAPVDLSTLDARLEAGEAVPLDDLVFGSGSAALASGEYASLAALAAYLDAHPDARVALVGHTDASGALDANVALSRRRAQAVRDRLASEYGTPRARVDAEGVGYLAPRASNQTEAGRTRNRRVEALLTSTP